VIGAVDVSWLGTRLGKDGLQLSYVVRDLEATLHFWTRSLGVGPFVVIENAATDRVVAYRGRKTQVTMTLAFAYVRDIQIEIIVASCPDPTPWTEFLDSGRQGLHHIAMWPDAFDAACSRLETLSFIPECRIETNTGVVSSIYFRGPEHLGHMVEVAPNSPSRRRYFGGIRALATGWNGSRPIRRFASREDYLASNDCPGHEVSTDG
jgi:catechol 2,3-dioxygenase-like lactoylglutathione lyase family enzyme